MYLQRSILFFTALILVSTLALAQNDDPAGGFTGMDENVNETLAQEAGLEASDPLINFEALGEVWNAILMLAGGVCGFILGRNWDLLWGKTRRPSGRSDDADRKDSENS